jgi:L-threonylcarbamoyladenylate synthase
MQLVNLQEDKQKALKTAREYLAAGKLVVFPTETCYGVAADATNAEAVGKLLKYKDRPAGKAISVAVAGTDKIFDLIESNPQAEKVAKQLLPGPVTLISRSLGKVDKRLETETGTLGVRVSSHEFVQELLADYPNPITATSANPAGKANPYSIDQLRGMASEAKLGLLDLAVDAGTLPKMPPSVVVDTTIAGKVHREGLLTAQDLATGQIETATDLEATKRLARGFATKLAALGREKSPSLIAVLLEGELGAGKTTFAAALISELGVTRTVSSPTYTIVKEYDLPQSEPFPRIYHADLWRVETPVSAAELGIEPAQTSRLLLVEWPDQLRLDGAIATIFRVKILKLGEHSRRFIITDYSNS